MTRSQTVKKSLATIAVVGAVAAIAVLNSKNQQVSTGMNLQQTNSLDMNHSNNAMKNMTHNCTCMSHNNQTMKNMTHNCTMI